MPTRSNDPSAGESRSPDVTARSLRSKAQRNALYIAAGGLCVHCNEPLGRVFHADHITPWKTSNRTNVHELQALCPRCNLHKGSKIDIP